MSMPALNNRLQVLVDDELLEDVSAAAKEGGLSVGEYVRRSLANSVGDLARQRKIKEYIDFMESIEPIDFGTAEESLEEIRRASVRDFFLDEEEA